MSLDQDSLRVALEPLLSQLRLMSNMEESRMVQRLMEDRFNSNLYSIVVGWVEKHLGRATDPNEVLQSEAFTTSVGRLKARVVELVTHFNDLSQPTHDNLFPHFDRALISRSDSLATDDTSFTLSSLQGVWPLTRDGHHYERLAQLLLHGDDEDREHALRLILALITTHNVDSMASSALLESLLRGLRATLMSLTTSKLALRVHSRLIAHFLATSAHMVTHMFDNIVHSAMAMYTNGREEPRHQVALMRMLKCLVNFALSLPDVWYRYPLRLRSSLMEMSMPMFKLLLSSHSHPSLLLFMAVVDVECQWMKCWFHALTSRQVVLQSMKKEEVITLTELLIKLSTSLEKKLDRKYSSKMMIATHWIDRYEIQMAQLMFTSSLLSLLLPHFSLGEKVKGELLDHILNLENELILEKEFMLNLVNLDDKIIRKELQLRLDMVINQLEDENKARGAFRARLIIDMFDNDRLDLHTASMESMECMESEVIYLRASHVSKMASWVDRAVRDVDDMPKVSLATQLASILIEQPWLRVHLSEIFHQLKTSLTIVEEELSDRTPTNSMSHLNGITETLLKIETTFNTITEVDKASAKLDQHDPTHSDEDDQDETLQDVLVDPTCFL